MECPVDANNENQVRVGPHTSTTGSASPTSQTTFLPSPAHFSARSPDLGLSDVSYRVGPCVMTEGRNMYGATMAPSECFQAYSGIDSCLPHSSWSGPEHLIGTIPMQATSVETSIIHNPAGFISAQPPFMENAPEYHPRSHFFYSQQQLYPHPPAPHPHSNPVAKQKRRRVATVEQRKAANVRERKRMLSLNKGIDELRKIVPTFAYEKKLSRIETLRLAMVYIAFMTDIVNGIDAKDIKLKRMPSSCSPIKKLPIDAKASRQIMPATSLRTVSSSNEPLFCSSFADLH
ncbi:uncharacterized protein [Ptychodera flava]|uniref:uncharacterized protein n=1 Tax=Ptychodera flava TaxID=63121 RepID=UPI003969C890